MLCCIILMLLDVFKIVDDVSFIYLVGHGMEVHELLLSFSV